VNGKRRHGMALSFLFGQQGSQSPVDLDLIPTSAVERIEILRDGAAAQYGSDAIAGVINIILKANDHGGYASATYGQNGDQMGSIDDLGRTRRGLFNQGFQVGESGALSLSAELDDIDSYNAIGKQKGSMYFPLASGAPDPRENGDRYRQLNGGPSSSKQVFSYNFELPLENGLKPYSFSTYAHREAAGPGAYRTATSQQNLVSIYPDGYLNSNVVEEDDFQSVFGVTGEDWHGWRWDASSSYGRNHARLRNENSLAPSFGNASASNPIAGYTAPPTDLYNGGVIFSQWTNNFDVSRSIDTGVFDAPLSASFGVEYRDERFQELAGEYASYADGGYTYPAGSPLAGLRPNPGGSGTGGFSPEREVDESRNNKSFYADFSQRLTKRWEVGLAGRYEKYSDVGDTISGKLSTRYEFIDNYAVRATINNGFRAPSLQQQYFSQSSPIWGINQLTGVKGIINQIYTNPSDPVAKALGAKDLKPEKSTNFSIGLTGQPTANLDFSLDLYQIDIRDRIILQSRLQGARVTQILADAGLISPSAGNSYQVSYVSNGIDTRTRGADLVVNYRTDYGPFGKVKWSLLSAQNETKITKVASVPGALSGALSQSDFFPRENHGYYTSENPRNKTSLVAAWTLDKWDVTATAKRYSQVTTVNASDASRDTVIKPAWVADLDIGYTFGDSLRVSAGGTNIFGRRPQKDSLAQQAFDSQEDTYSAYAPYGNNGAFYYTKLEYFW